MKNKKILFISHDASRSGAPILLLNLAEILIKNRITVEFLLKTGGPLEKDFKLKGQTYIVKSANGPTLFQRIINKPSSIRRSKYKIENLPWHTYDYILSNTITNGDILPQIRLKYNGPIISYIHELEMSTYYATEPYFLNQLIKTSNWFLVPSKVVKKHLIENLSIENEKIDILQYYIPAQSCKDYPIEKGSKSEFTVGCIGTAEWRKGTDLFIQVALIILKKSPNANIRFVWKGVLNTGSEREKLLYDINKAGLTGEIILLPSSENVKDFYESIDVLFLSSREDPYPLAVLEAADYSVPTICFKNAGGAQEFIEESGGGLTVNYLDLNEAAENIINYSVEERRRFETGKKAKAFLCSTHQNENYIIDQFENIISKVLNQIDI
ncbi:MAG: glycosyltransferase family 4 protein [Bacteroidetes bacterium]|nr:glycosyltransferase family 4 protein [Bacteroidota bacterium]